MLFWYEVRGVSGSMQLGSCELTELKAWSSPGSIVIQHSRTGKKKQYCVFFAYGMFAWHASSGS